MIRKGFRINDIPLKVYASMKVEAASQPVQEYDAVLGEYYPDRTLVPLVLVPQIGYTDPNTLGDVANAASELTNGHWYRLDATTGGVCNASTEITSGGLYTIDTTAGSATYGKISIRENVLPGNPVTYIYRATLSHAGSDPVMREVSFQARTKATETIPRLSLDQASESLYNPWEDAATFSIGPVLKPAVSGATYAWQTLHGGTWGALGSTHYDWALSVSGNRVTIDRSRMQGRIDLRCVCTYSAGGKQHTVMVTAAVVRLLPRFEYDITRLSNPRRTDTSVAPLAVIRTAKGLVTDPAGEVTVTWYGASNSPVGYGMNPVIPLSSLGSALELGLEILDAGGWKALETADGKYLTDSQGRLLIAR